MAVLAGGLVFFLGTLGGGGGGASATKVVVAKQDIPLRKVITDADLDLQPVSGSFSNITYANKSDVITLISQIKISAHSVITSDMLAKDINVVPGGAAPAYLPLASGYVAYTVPTNEMQGVAGHISVGDYMTVIASGSIQIFQKGPTTSPVTKVVSKTVFRDLRVIGLGPATAGVTPAAGAGTGSAAPITGVTSSLTLEISQCDAEYFTWLLNNMSLKYTLESYKDYLKTPPTDNSDPNCRTIQDAKGVSQDRVDTRFGFTTT
jgi:Flp pilus assembly protein CpaB